MKKNPRKNFGIVILILIAAFWGLVFFMRDKNPDWCNLSWGTYDLVTKDIPRDLSRAPMDWGMMPSSKKVGDCEGGIFGFMD